VSAGCRAPDKASLYSVPPTRGAGLAGDALDQARVADVLDEQGAHLLSASSGGSAVPRRRPMARCAVFQPWAARMKVHAVGIADVAEGVVRRDERRCARGMAASRLAHAGVQRGQAGVVVGGALLMAAAWAGPVATSAARMLAT
jgi:hypothetical protein